jgi:hypothetical protein
MLRTLPLSGRQGAWGGTAESWWWPVHSRGLFEVSFPRPDGTSLMAMPALPRQKNDDAAWPLIARRIRSLAMNTP